MEALCGVFRKYFHVDDERKAIEQAIDNVRLSAKLPKLIYKGEVSVRPEQRTSSARTSALQSGR